MTPYEFTIQPVRQEDQMEVLTTILQMLYYQENDEMFNPNQLAFPWGVKYLDNMGLIEPSHRKNLKSNMQMIRLSDETTEFAWMVFQFFCAWYSNRVDGDEWRELERRSEQDIDYPSDPVLVTDEFEKRLWDILDSRNFEKKLAYLAMYRRLSANAESDSDKLVVVDRVVNFATSDNQEFYVFQQRSLRS